MSRLALIALLGTVTLPFGVVETRAQSLDGAGLLGREPQYRDWRSYDLGRAQPYAVRPNPGFAGIYGRDGRRIGTIESRPNGGVAVYDRQGRRR